MTEVSARLPKPIIANRRQLLVGGAAVATVGLTVARPGRAYAATTALASVTATAGTSTGLRQAGGVDRATIQRWATDTWASMVAMTHPGTGLPADNISGPLGSPTRSGYTSPTNIGGYLWSTVVARERGILGAGESRKRLAPTLSTLKSMEHQGPHGLVSH